MSVATGEAEQRDGRRSDAKSAAATDERRSPLRAHIFLLIGFLLVTVASVFTVLIPELVDDGEEEDAAPAASSAEAPAATP